MTAISASPDRERRRTTPPAALMTLTSATSKILVATVAPSSAETFGASALRESLTAKPGRVEDCKRNPRDQGRGGNRGEPREDDGRAQAPAHGGQLLADSDAHHPACDHVSGADRKGHERGALVN